MNQHHRTHATLTHAGPGKPTTLSNTAVASSATDHHGRLACTRTFGCVPIRSGRPRVGRRGMASSSGWKRNKNW